MKWPCGQEAGALTKCQARHLSRHQHRPEPSLRRDAGLPSPKASSPDTAGAAVPGMRSHALSCASSSLPEAQPAVTPPGTGCQRCRLCRQAEDHRHPGQSRSGPSPNGAASRLQHTGHVCTVGSAREMETVTLLAWHPSQHPQKPPSQQCLKGRFATGTECCKKGAWLLGLDMLLLCGQSARGSPHTGERRESFPHRGILSEMKQQNPPKGLE